jgi:DNA polymerase
MNCPNGFKCIGGDGPVNAEIMCVGEAPGKVESYTNIPLTGPTGLEFNQTYLPLAGLKRENVYVTNTVKHTSTINRKPTEADIKMCVECKLRSELLKVKPEIVILMGATACSLISDIDLDTSHGVPFQGELFGWEYIIVPMWHPALGLHKTNAMTDLIDDWTKFGEWLKWREADSLGVLVDNGPYPIDNQFFFRDYQLIKSVRDIAEYFDDAGGYPKLIGVDTESHGSVDFSVQFSLAPGSARMVLCEDLGLMDEWQAWMNEALVCNSEIVLHNAPADIPVLNRLGLSEFPYRDTMQEAYQLCRYPQALKALSYRLLGRKRKSWSETVTPPSKLVLQQWLLESITYAENNLTYCEKRWSKSGKPIKPKVHVSPVEKALKSLLGHSISSESYDVWGKLRERVSSADLGLLEEVLGQEVPVKGIKYCSLEEQLYYSASDADDTLALALEFERIRSLGVDVNEDDYDAVRRD